VQEVLDDILEMSKEYLLQFTGMGVIHQLGFEEKVLSLC